jgi:anthranilate synthase component 1
MRRARLHRRDLTADVMTPLEAYRRLRTRSSIGFLLESVIGGEQVSRYSLLATAPSRIYRLYPDRLEEEGPEGIRRLPGPPLQALLEVAAAIQAAPQDIPFVGGLVGYLGFEVATLLEDLPPAPPDPFGLPLAILGRFDSGVVFDRARQRLVLVANEIEGEISAADAAAELEALHATVATPLAAGGGVVSPLEAEPTAAAGRVVWPGEAFRSAVARVREHIAAGDAYQVVLARRWLIDCRARPLELYRALRIVNPSPYMVLLELPEVATVGASPEMLVRVTGQTVEARPIAGTRRRGRNPAEDRALGEELLSDPKERAEHVMLVDLGRNDVGRVARAGSVRVDEFMQIERYSHVMHMVSSVEGVLDDERSSLAALLACFPAGTVAGAGAVGYLSFAGDLDSCISIRTLVVRDGEVSVTAGAGIVADSDPRSEEEETENKAAALLAAVGLAESTWGPT